MFVGRRDELVALAGELTLADGGTSRVVLLTGAAGSGKSALLRHLLAGVDAVVASAWGEEAEALHPFGVLDQLVAGLGGSRAREIRDPFLAGAVLLDLVGGAQAASGRPVLLVVDDAQWADTASVRALTFVLRRLHADRVLTVVACRDDADSGLDGVVRLADARGAALRLGGLGVADLRVLGEALGGEPLSRQVAERLRRHTDGHPLTARALLEELGPALLREAPDPLPAPRSYAMLVLRRLAGCSGPAERLVVATAVLGRRTDLELAARVAELDDPLPALAEATAAGLLELVDTRAGRSVTFGHQLIQAAVYHDLAPDRRLRLHAAAARLPVGATSLEHRAAAAVGRDAVLAGAVAEQAAAETALGATAVAGDHLLLAARLHPDGATSTRLLLDGVLLLLMAGEVARAGSWEREVSALPTGARQRLVLGQLAALAGRQDDAAVLLAESVQLAEATETTATAWSADPATMAAILLGHLCLVQARAADAGSWGRRALDRAGGDPALVDAATAVIVLAMGTSGRAGTGLELVSSLHADTAQLGDTDQERLLARGIVRLWSDDLIGASTDLNAITNAGARRPLRLRLAALGCLTKAEFRLGAWDDSLAHGALAAALAEDSDHRWALAFLHAMAGLVPASRGSWESAHAHAAAATAAAATLGTDTDRAYAAWIRAHLAWARGDPGGVVDAIEPVLDLRRRDGFAEPGVTPWRELYVDALVTVGRLDEAAAELAVFESLARERGRRGALAAAAAVRGRLLGARGEDRAASSAFESALSQLDDLPTPFARATVSATYGAHLRRRGRRRQAVGHLESARCVLDGLGAAPFLDRCDRELAAASCWPGPRSDAGRRQLTPQEIAVARLVAGGHTNRQIAAELVGSVKTVEYHLGHVFTKLDMRSRSQVAARFATGHPFAHGPAGTLERP